MHCSGEPLKECHLAGDTPAVDTFCSKDLLQYIHPAMATCCSGDILQWRLAEIKITCSGDASAVETHLQ